ncbi:MAG: VTT domain-containing protein [Candidatus Brocadiaceae bacterium]|nr:VTT domain-containing protein [Candidatus Brocadiaceae bacterium]
MPGSVLTIAGGVLFGPIWGTFYNLTGATIGATVAFLIARYLASDLVLRKMGGRLKQLVEGVEAEGWRFVAFVRLVPLFPFNLLNYALGLTRIRLFHCVVTSFVCMLPGAIAYTYLGYAGRNAVAGGEGMIQKALLGLGLLAFVAFLPRLIKRLRKKPVRMLSVAELKQRLDKREDILVIDVRSAEEYVGDLGHIGDSRNIAIEDLPRRLDELNAYQQRSIVIVCRTDQRSLKAAQMLTKAGFSRVTVLQGGMVQWNRIGLPVDR